MSIQMVELVTLTSEPCHWVTGLLLAYQVKSTVEPLS